MFFSLLLIIIKKSGYRVHGREGEHTLQEFSFVHGELGSKFEALGLFLGDELEEVCVSGSGQLHLGGGEATYFSASVKGGLSSTVGEVKNGALGNTALFGLSFSTFCGCGAEST